MGKRLCLALIAALAASAAGGDMPTRDGARDFDFWMGSWRIHNKRLRQRLEGSTTWDEFEATAVARPLLGGVGNEDVFRTDFAGGYTGMSLRFYDKSTGRWSIYWADSRRGVLDPPVVGSFEGDRAVFEGPDTFEGRPILVRFIWSRVTTPSPRWEQAFSEDGGKSWETNWVMDMTRDDVTTKQQFPIVELRRYAIKPGQRERFARLFEAYFPEAFQAMGLLSLGQFQERANAGCFTWLRSFPSYDARMEMNTAFYTNPLWKEHAKEMNDILLDADNVLLLRPLHPGKPLAVLPSVDPLTNSAAPRGVVFLHILPGTKDTLDGLAAKAEESFATYRLAGAREAGVLVTLDAPNNYPRLPIREDGPFLVWVGIVKDEAMLTRLDSAAANAEETLTKSGLLRGAAERVVLDPTPRSRLRFIAERN
jgi:hypothetical protein